MKIIFNADDYGLCQAVNEGIIASHLNGVVTSTTMMVGMPGEQDALARLLSAPNLSVGIHLRLTAGRPLSSHFPIVTPEGSFPKYDALMAQLKPVHEASIYDEFHAQIERFMSYGVPLSHLDSHHHVHFHPVIGKVVARLSHEFDIPYRATPTITGYQFSDGFYDDNISLDWLKSQLSIWSERYDVVEVMCHPAIVDDELASMSSYLEKRELELDVLSSRELKQHLQDHQVELTRYSAVI
ncbi:chitin disaccharide deacetylase [Vibrio sp. 10N]|uniref:chitin disaccharide deacetylase n=1 Tax=Vibrio sp. 10N TaxID=3058938 RepID=UPI002813708D|nr:chitin disaccharide deacetylase [Vibrio sp. 10N]